MPGNEATEARRAWGRGSRKCSASTRNARERQNGLRMRVTKHLNYDNQIEVVIHTGG